MCTFAGKQETCQDYHVHRVDNDFFFNVCNNAMRKPPECSDLFGLSPAQAFRGSHPLHLQPYTLHPTPYTLHPTTYPLHPTPYTLHPTP